MEMSVPAGGLTRPLDARKPLRHLADQQFEPCWPAVCDGLHGLVLVYDASSKAQSSEIRVWAEWFIKQAKLDEADSDMAGRVQAMAINGAATKPITVKMGNQGNT
jgi:hypothetical protein